MERIVKISDFRFTIPVAVRRHLGIVRGGKAKMVVNTVGKRHLIELILK